MEYLPVRPSHPAFTVVPAFVSTFEKTQEKHIDCQEDRGKPKTLISEVDADSGSSGSNSKSADSVDATGRKKTNKTVKEVRKISG